MRRIFLLAKTMIKGIGAADVSGDSGSDKKKLKKISMTLLLVFVGIYMAGLSVTFVHFTYGLLSGIGFESLIIGLAVSVTSFIVFFFGLFYVMSVYYFSKDVDKLLPLPVRPGEIILAKFLSTLFYEYIIVLLFLLPAMVTYGVLSKAGILFYVYAIITALLVPVTPLVFASILMMVVMRFTPLARNKDRFSLFAGIFSLILALGINFGIQSLMSRNDESALAEIISGSADKITGIVSRIFPGTWFANYALVRPDFFGSAGMMLIFAAISSVFLLILYYAGNLLYFKGVIGVSSSASGSRKITGEGIKELTAGGNPFFTYVFKELRILFRTPIFFMNNVIMNFLMPAFIFLPFVFSGGDGTDGPPSISVIRTMISEMISGPDKSFAVYTVLAFFGILVFTFGVNGITETAISREGKCAYVMKIIPMSYNKQVAAKITTGILMSLSGAVILTIVLSFVFTPPVWLVLVCIAAIPGAVVLPNVTGMIFDLHMPKIKWDNEQKAVKQNLNVIFGMFASMIMIALIAVPVLMTDMGIPLSLAYITIFPLFLAAISAYYVNRIATKCMLQLSA